MREWLSVCVCEREFRVGFFFQRLEACFKVAVCNAERTTDTGAEENGEISGRWVLEEREKGGETVVREGGR